MSNGSSIFEMNRLPFDFGRVYPLPRVGREMPQLHPANAMAGNAISDPVVEELENWTSVTGWTGYNPNGSATGIPTFAVGAGNGRYTAADCIQVTWDPAGASTQNGQYVTKAITTAVELYRFNWLGLWAISDAVTVSTDLVAGFYDSGGNLLGTEIALAAITTAAVWQLIEIDLRAIRGALEGRSPTLLRITHNTSGTGSDVMRFQGLLGYYVSNGHGPAMGPLLRAPVTSGLTTRGQTSIAVPGRPGRFDVGASDATGFSGILCEGSEFQDGDLDDPLLVPDADGEYGVLQYDGFAYMRAAGTVAKGDPLALASATTVDVDPGSAKAVGEALETAVLGQDFLVKLKYSGPAVAVGDLATLAGANSWTGDNTFQAEVLVTDFSEASKFVSSCSHWEEDFLGAALDPRWVATKGAGAATAAALTANGSRGIFEIACGTANGATAWACIDTQAQHNLDPGDGPLLLAWWISLSSVASGQFHFGIAQTVAGIGANPPAYLGIYVAAQLEIGTSANWYFGGDNAAPSDSSIVALTKQLVYVMTVDTTGNASFFVYDPSTPGTAPSTFTKLLATATGATMAPFCHVSSEDANSRSLYFDRFECWQGYV